MALFLTAGNLRHELKAANDKLSARVGWPGTTIPDSSSSTPPRGIDPTTPLGASLARSGRRWALQRRREVYDERKGSPNRSRISSKTTAASLENRGSVLHFGRSRESKNELRSVIN